MHLNTRPLRLAAIMMAMAVCICSRPSEIYGQRVYADAEQHAAPLLSVVDSSQNAIDANHSNYSTLTLTLGLLGANAWQNLEFTGGAALPKPDPNSPITIRFRGNKALASLLSNITVQVTDAGNAVGTAYSGSNLLDLLGLLSSSDSSEYTIPPAGINFDGIRLKVGGIVSLAMSAYYYYAFFVATPVVNDTDFCSSGHTNILQLSNKNDVGISILYICNGYSNC